MVQRRKALKVLTRQRLVEIAKRLKVPGLSSKGKAQVVDALVAARAVKSDALLKLFHVEELKAVCRAVGVNDNGRSKAQLIARLLDGQIGKRIMAKKANSGTRRPAIELRNQAGEPYLIATCPCTRGRQPLDGQR